jgi:hypothetical protein
MATVAQRDRLRRDVGATEASLSDEEADALFEEAEETYSVAGSITAYTRVLAIRGMLADASKLTTYRQNASSENASDVYKHLRDLLNLWQGELVGNTPGAYMLFDTVQGCRGR